MRTREGKKRAGNAKGKARSKSEPNGWVAPFPKPANPAQRYDPDHPWLAIVNARGPQGLWKHEKIGPSWQPWCPDLFNPETKSKKNRWWQRQSPACQLFTFALWRFAAVHSVTGIIWGESESLRRQMKMSDGKIMGDRQQFAAFLEAHAQAGFICYLSDAEKEAAERLIFAKQHKGTETETETETEQKTGENSTASVPGSGVVVYESNNPSSRQATGQESESTAQHEGRATAAGSAAAPGQEPEPINPKEPQAGAASPEAPAGPRIDGRPQLAQGSGKGIPAQPAGRQGGGRQHEGEVKPVADCMPALHWQHPPSVAYGCGIYNILFKPAFVHPENVADAGDDVTSEVGNWAKAFYLHDCLHSEEAIKWVEAKAKHVAKYQKNRAARGPTLRKMFNKHFGISRRGPPA